MPFTSQATEVSGVFETVAAKVTRCPVTTVAFCGETLMATLAVTLLTIATVALADFEASATLVAVIVTVAGEGTASGAV